MAMFSVGVWGVVSRMGQLSLVCSSNHMADLFLDHVITV